MNEGSNLQPCKRHVNTQNDALWDLLYIHQKNENLPFFPLPVSTHLLLFYFSLVPPPLLGPQCPLLLSREAQWDCGVEWEKKPVGTNPLINSAHRPPE